MTIPESQAAEAGSRRWLTTERLLTLVVAVVLVAIVTFVWYRSTSSNGGGGVVATGKFAPNFTVPSPDGGSLQLADFRGKVVLVNFWATWCGPCKAEMPHLEEAYHAYQGQGFEIVGVDQAEDAGAVRSYVTDNGFGWTFGLDQTGDVSRRYGVYGIPTSFLIDRNGKVAYIWNGPLTPDSLRQQLSRLGITN